MGFAEAGRILDCWKDLLDSRQVFEDSVQFEKASNIL